MEWNAETLQFLSQQFLQSLSSIPEPRRLAESHLSEAAERPNYSLAVLRLIAEPTVEDQTRLAAAVNFKNHLRARWVPPRHSDPNVPLLPSIADHEKEQIKALILPLMLSSTPQIQSQLSDALSIIGKHDFPRAWPSLLPELVLRLRSAAQTSDYTSINGMLSTANSIFKKFRFQFKTNDLLLDLKYCLDNFAAPLLEIFLHTTRMIDPLASSPSAAHTLRPLIESQRLCCKIFYSLNFQELPEFFEDHMKEWMTEFKKYLTTMYPALEKGDGVGLKLVDGLRAAVCENINLYIKANEEEFKVYLNDFAQVVWSLLGNVSATLSREKITIAAIKFLTTVSTSVHHTLFAGEGVIQQISQGVVIPNVQLTEEDEELFAMNYVEFIRRDIEGSDNDTKRRIACELLKGIATNYKDQVTKIVSSEIQNKLSSFAANPSSNWKDKDCVIYLVVSLATKKDGGNSVSTDLVDAGNFFEQVIVPELQNQDINGFPMLKAGALKFFTMFRNQITKPVGLSLLPEVVRFLGAESNVVHSYAAICIDKLLQIKDNGGVARNSAMDIEPFLPLLMTYLFNALKFSDSEENPYIMKCIMRVLGVANISPVIAGPCIAGLTSVLGEVCKNPKNPIFNHYLFEAVAILVKRACEKDSSLTTAFEANLFPSLEIILSNDISEFLPYAFQLFAQLVEINRSPIPQSYMQIFQQLLNPATWKKSANVPALVRLLQSFLEKARQDLIRENKIPQVLGIFNMLIHSPSTDQQGFYVLNTVTENLTYEVMAPFTRNIWLVLFNRLQNNPPVKFLKSFLIFMSLFLVKYGPANLVSSMNAVQENIFLMVLEQFWIPNLKWITGTTELKLTSVASTRLLCECPSLSDPGSLRHWGKMLDSIVTLLSRPEEDRIQEDLEVPDIEEFVGYTATFVRLYNAGKKEEDPLIEIRDPKQFLVASLANLSTHSPGRYSQIISENLDPANQTSLLGLFSTYKLAMV